MFDEFVRVVRSGVEALPENSDVSRSQLYDSLRGSFDRHLTANPNAIVHKLELDAAISLVEADFTSFETASASIDDVPQSPWQYALAKLLLGCSAFGALVDILKPIANFEMAVAALCLLGTIFLTALMRVMPAWRRRLNWSRTFCAGTLAVLVGLFGIGVILPNGAPNGVVAEAIPPVMELQHLIAELRDPIERTAANTEVLIQQSTGTNERLDRINTALDPTEQGRQFLELRGYEVGDKGYVKALIEDDYDALSAFSLLGIKLSPDGLRAALQAVAMDTERFRSVLSHAEYGGTPQARTALRDDVRSLAELVDVDFGLNAVYDAVCGNADPEPVVSWIREPLSADCGDETRWYLAASNRIESVLEHFSLEWDTRTYSVRAEPSADAALFDDELIGLFRARALIVYQNKMLSFFSEDFSDSSRYDFDRLNSDLDCSAAPCWAEIHALRDSGSRLTLLHVTAVERGPFPTPAEVAENATNSFEWSVGYMPRWGLLGAEDMMFLSAFDPENSMGVGLFCRPHARSDTLAVLRFAQGIDGPQFSSILFQVGSDGAPSGVGRLSFPNGTFYEGRLSAQGTHLKSIRVGADFIKQMVRSKTARFTTPDRGGFAIRLDGFARALEVFRKYTGCAQ